MHRVTLNANGELPDYLSILNVEENPLFSKDEFQFTDVRLNGLMLDSTGVQINRTAGDTTVCVCDYCDAYLTDSWPCLNCACTNIFIRKKSKALWAL